MGLNGSSDGGMIRSHLLSIQSGANSAREKTWACAGSTSSRRNAPGLLGPLVALVEAHVASPHDRGTPVPQGLGEPSGLRVVQEDDVTGLHAVDDLGAVSRQRGVVRRPRGRVQRTRVAGDAVQPVVDPLGDGEEVGVPAQHQPADVDPGARRIGHQGVQHLRDTTAARRRLTFHTVRPPSSRRAAAAYVSIRSMRSGGSSDSRRCSETGATRTSTRSVGASSGGPSGTPIRISMPGAASRATSRASSRCRIIRALAAWSPAATNGSTSSTARSDA